MSKKLFVQSIRKNQYTVAFIEFNAISALVKINTFFFFFLSKYPVKHPQIFYEFLSYIGHQLTNYLIDNLLFLYFTEIA